MPWKPGESGNPGGRGTAKPFLDVLNRAIAQDDGKRLRTCAENLLTLAANGEAWAVQMLADRLDGKPKQQTEVTGADGAPLLTSIAIELVRASTRETV